MKKRLFCTLILRGQRYAAQETASLFLSLDAKCEDLRTLKSGWRKR